jgi:iron(III) transport system ATP-binding protein
VQRPATAFVGRFVLQANLLPARWRGEELATPVGNFEMASSRVSPSDPGLPLQLLVRPTDLTVLPAGSVAGRSGDDPPDPEARPGVEVEVLGREFLGRDWLYQMGLGSLRLRVRLPLAVALERGERCRLALRPEAEPLLFPSGLPLRASSPGPLQRPSTTPPR